MDPSNHSESSRRLAIRPPNIDAALQRTPLTSIVPFDPDMIPFSSAIPANQSLNILTEEEQLAARRLFQDLDALSDGPGALSPAFQEPLSNIQRYLNADNLTELKFQALPSLQPDVWKDQQNNSTNKPRQKSESKLGPTAKMILNTTDVRFRYPTPGSVDSVSLQSATAPFAKAPRELGQISTLTPSFLSNAKSFEQNAAIDLGQGHGPLLTPARSTNGQRSPHQPAIIISKVTSPSEKKAYDTFPEIDDQVIQESAASSRKRKRDDDVDDEPIRINFDQQQRANEALGTLMDLIQDKIFVAEDHLEPDTSGVLPVHATEYFASATAGQSDIYILKPFVQIKLHTAMQNVVSNDRFQDVPSEYLLRLQKICSQTLRAIDGVDLNQPEEISDDIEEDWSSRLELANNSLLSSKCLLKIMTARSSDKELCSEEILQEILTTLKHILEECVIPTAEIDDPKSEKRGTQMAIRQKATLIRLMQSTGRVLGLFGNLLILIDLSENIINTLEFFSTRLLFVETNSFEKDSVLGVQRFFSLRKIAMEVVAKVFFRKPAQRQGIFTEILSSLEKLPGTRQSARQFKIIEKKPITLVSALIMQLVQMSSTKSVQSSSAHDEKRNLGELEDSDSHSDVVDSPSKNGILPSGPAIGINHQPNAPLQKLTAFSKPLSDNAQKNAAYVAKYLIERAVNTSKSGDLPYRNLLDIFVEDFLNVLGSTDWPAAEILLRILLSHLIGIIETDKSSAPAKTMALDLMGLMSSGIADLQNYVRRNAFSIQKSESELGDHIGQLADVILEGKAMDGDILTLNGPYRLVAEFLRDRDIADLQIQGALSYYLSQWARSIWTSFETARQQLDADEEDEISPWDCDETALWLNHMLLGQEDLADSRGYHSVPIELQKFSYALSVLTMPFCKALRRILNILLKSLSNSLPTIRNRSLISISQLVENDPGILDRADSIMGFIVPCFSDQSSLVRNSALSFIEKFLLLKPELEGETCSALIAISSDASLAVRKHTIKLLKGIYLRNKSTEIRSTIANTILQRLIDQEDSVRELARQTMEEMWLSPFHKAVESSDRSTQVNHEIQQHAWLIVRTTQEGDNVLSMVETLFRDALIDSAKNAKSNLSVTKSLVHVMVDGVIDNETASGLPSQQLILQTLTAFAKCEPRLFDSEHMKNLEPYIQNVSKDDNFLVYRSVIIIFRCVLPVLQSLPVAFLSSVQTTLMKSITRLGKLELNEISQCLWIIDGVLKNTDRLVKLTRSLLVQIQGARSKPLIAGSDPAIKISRLITILGYFGKACNLEDHLTEYKDDFAGWKTKNPSVSGLMIHALLSFTSPSTPIEVRRAAFESICLICQAWPKNFLSIPVCEAFDQVLVSETRDLEQIILAGFKAFYESQAQQSQGKADEENNENNSTGADRLGKSMTVNENDGASSGIAQKFLDQVLRIALSSVDNLALLATEIVVSTNSQGLVHPRECGPGLIALSTSPNQLIAKIATREHHNIHQKHESMLEKQYVKAIEQAYEYQRNTIGQISGVADDSTTPKLKPFFDVLKSGSVQSRKKLYSNLCKQLNLDMSKRPQFSDLLLHLQYASFVLQNMSLVDYARIDELLHLISCIEKAFMGTGTTLSQNIEARLGISPASHQTLQAAGAEQHFPLTAPQVDLLEFQTLTAVSMVMSMFWVTRDYLQRTWNLAKYRSGKIKLAAKDINRAPIKNPAADPQKLINKFIAIMVALNSNEAMEAQCRDFMEHLSVDTELKVNSEDDDQAAGGYETPSEADESNSVPPSGGSRASKRKGSMSAASTPSKIKRRMLPISTKRRTSSSRKDDDEDSGGWD